MDRDTKQNYKMQVADGLNLVLEKMAPRQRILFMAGFLSAFSGINPHTKTINALSDIITNIHELSIAKVISYNNFIEIFVQASLAFKAVAGTYKQEDKFKRYNERVEFLLGETMTNQKYIRQKWLNQGKGKDSSILNAYSNIKQEQDEETIKMIKKLQEEDRLNYEKSKIQLEKQSEASLRKFLQEDQKKRKQKHQIQEKKLQCEICLEQIPYSDLGTLSCGHIFHKSCIFSHIEAHVKEKKIQISCPSACGAQLSIDDIYEYIDGEIKQKFDKFSFDIYVERNDKFASWCPTANCPAVFTHDGVLDNYRCPACSKHYCLNCKVDYHKGMTCAQFKVSRTWSEDDKKFQEFVVGAKYKQCPNCNFWVERTQGCCSMACRCGIQFCYDCGGTGCPHGSCSNSGKAEGAREVGGIRGLLGRGNRRRRN